MKAFYLIIISVISLMACSPTHNGKEKAINDTISKVDAKPLTVVANINANMKGIWWDANEKDAPTASFEIKETTIFYPDQEGKSEYKYVVKHDSMIFYFDGYTSISKILKTNKDTLQLLTDGEEQTFVRRNEEIINTDTEKAKINKKQVNNITKAIKAIKRVFDDYVAYNESTDSKDNKDLMTNSLQSLNKVTDQKHLEILINVWMYYDPTDFPSRDLVVKILKNSKPESIIAIKARIKNKKSWEKDDTAPYTELNDLLKQINK